VQFISDREPLTEALSNASRALSSRGSITGLRWTVTAGLLEIEGRESDLSIRSTVPVDGSDTHFTTPAALAVDLMKSLPGERVEVVIEDATVSFRSGRAEVSLNLLNEFDVPPLGVEDQAAVTVPSVELANGISQVAIAASRDDTRDLIYSGMLFSSSPEGLRLVATDGIRLALRDIAGINMLNDTNTGEVVIPTRAVRELERILSSSAADQLLSVRIGAREAVFSVGSTTLATRLIDEPFRDYRRLVDVSYSRVMLADRSQLVSALRTLRRMAKEARNSSMLRMTITGTACELSVKIPQIGQVHEVIDVNFSDEEFAISFDPDLLADGIDGVESDVVRFEFLESNRAASITNSDSRSFMYLLMPIVQK
jgi:DNA polymerase-3 subunit beta